MSVTTNDVRRIVRQGLDPSFRLRVARVKTRDRVAVVKPGSVRAEFDMLKPWCSDFKRKIMFSGNANDKLKSDYWYVEGVPDDKIYANQNNRSFFVDFKLYRYNVVTKGYYGVLKKTVHYSCVSKMLDTLCAETEMTCNDPFAWRDFSNDGYVVGKSDSKMNHPAAIATTYHNDRYQPSISVVEYDDKMRLYKVDGLSRGNNFCFMVGLGEKTDSNGVKFAYNALLYNGDGWLPVISTIFGRKKLRRSRTGNPSLNDVCVLPWRSCQCNRRNCCRKLNVASKDVLNQLVSKLQ